VSGSNVEMDGTVLCHDLTAALKDANFNIEIGWLRREKERQRERERQREQRERVSDGTERERRERQRERVREIGES
jgi:hypothetical protein